MTSPAALVMAYGTPASLDDLEGFYTHIRRGRAPAPDQLAELRARYEAIGGVSPLADRTEAQRAAIARALPGGWAASLGMKHTAPFVEDSVARLAEGGHDPVVGVVLAPHWSASVAEYHDRADKAAREHGVAYRVVASWQDLDAWVSFQARAVRDAVDDAEGAVVLFTAHSLPERLLEGDPYPDQLAASARAIADGAGLAEDEWRLAWQSAGRTPEPWRGPDVLDELRRLAAEGVRGVVVCHQGFTSDHLEVLYDLDVEAHTVAGDVGLRLVRTPSVNDDSAVMAALAERVASRGEST